MNLFLRLFIISLLIIPIGCVKKKELVDEMELMITNNIINILKQNYGTESEGIYPNWFAQGIPQEVQLEISARSIQNKSSIDSSFMISILTSASFGISIS